MKKYKTYKGLEIPIKSDKESFENSSIPYTEYCGDASDGVGNPYVICQGIACSNCLYHNYTELKIYLREKKLKRILK